jgi:Rrf2 family protein
MKLTGLCTHALVALVYLARHERGGPVPADAVADREGLSGSLLSKGLKAMASSGLLHSLWGPKGGYRLARPARSITLVEEAEAIDGPVRGEARRVESAGGHQLDERLQSVCKEAAEVVRRRLRKVSLADLAGEG